MRFVYLFFILSFLSLFNCSAQISSYKRSVNKGNKNFEQQRYEDAIKKYESAIRIRQNKDVEEAEFNLGNARYKSNQLSDAATHYERVIQADTDQKLKAQAYHNLGNTYFKQRDYRNALESYKKSLLLNPEDDQTRYNLARTLAMLQTNQNTSQNTGGDNNENKTNQSEINPDDSQKNNDESTIDIDEKMAENLLQYLEKKDQKVQQKVREKEGKKRKSGKNEKDW